MLTPDFKEFQRLAKEATLVPVVKSVHADLLTPVSAFLSFAADEPNAIPTKETSWKRELMTLPANPDG